MDVSPKRREQRSSILLKGLGAGLTQWDDLKSWQVRQEALFIQSSPSKNQGMIHHSTFLILYHYNEIFTLQEMGDLQALMLRMDRLLVLI